MSCHNYLGCHAQGFHLSLQLGFFVCITFSKTASYGLLETLLKSICRNPSDRHTHGQGLLLFIQRPKNPTVNARTYSTYKSHNTFKFLVSITPNGAFNFISQIWGGNSSDRYITQHSGFLDLLSAGDEIMADRGFTIRDLLTERKVYLTIPPFTRKCNWGKGKYLCANDIKKTRKIANLRIHVERAIGRLKTFKLISQTIPWDMKSLVHPMVTVAAFFCNLHRPLVKA